MVALRNAPPFRQSSTPRPAYKTYSPTARLQPRQMAPRKQQNLLIYSLVWGFAFYLVTSTAYSLALGKLEPIYFMGLIAVALIMVINAFGEQLGLSLWFRILASFAMGWLIPTFMSGLYFFQNHIAM
jgi:hypothetical protein